MSRPIDNSGRAPEHPFYVNGTWVNAEDLIEGTVLTALDGDEIVNLGTITATERIEQEQVMYNLTVDTAHTFFVGEGEWLVHNTNPTDRKPWAISEWSEKAQGGPFNTTYYKDPNTGKWWSKDLKGDGGSAWKVYKEEAGKLIWEADADQYGDYMEKHKSPIGKEIKLKDMKMSGPGKGFLTSCP